MPKSPKAPPPMNVAAVTAQDTAAKKAAFGQTTIGQDNPYGSLTYNTSIDPITGEAKYQADMEYTPEQQAIFDYLQANQLGVGSTLFNNIDQNFARYGQDPNLIGGANSLTNEALDSMIPAWERFDAPARDQLRTTLLNQGITEDSPAYHQMMDKMLQQQDLDRGQWMANFTPQAYQMAKGNYEEPLNIAGTMFGMSQPGSIVQNLTQTPQFGPATDVAGLNIAAQEQAVKAWQAKVQAQNNMMSGIMGGLTSVATLPMGGVYGAPMSVGGGLMKSLMS